MKMPKGYYLTQSSMSSSGRGGKWGIRTGQSVDQYLKYFKGKILEAGCNDGFAMECLQKKGFKVEGIDIAKHKLKIAEEHGLKVHFGYQEKMPFKNKSFDTIFSSHTLEHSYDTKQSAEEYQRVSKRAIVIVPIEPNAPSRKMHVSPFHSKKDLIDLFKNKGKIVLEESRKNLQSEHVIIVDFHEA